MRRLPLALIALTFFVSGCAALIYQLVWQRYLFTGVGVDIDSVTLIVSSFMLGIGIGGALGGWMADRWPQQRLQLYALAELALAALGCASPWILAALPTLSAAGWPYAAVATACVLLVLVPTTIMGTTLPLLTMYFDETLTNVGVSVGLLYGCNTLGAACGAWLTAAVLFVLLGLQASAWAAAAMNLACFGLTLLAARLVTREGMQ